MSIADQISRLINAKKAIKASIENKGITIGDDVLLDEYPIFIDNISSGDNNTYLNPNFYDLKTKGGTNLNNLFAYYDGTELDLTNLDGSKATTLQYMFRNSTSLRVLDMSTWDWSNAPNLTYIFYQCTGLVEFYPPNNISSNLSLTTSPNLSHDSIIRIINNLNPHVSGKKITFHATTLAIITDEDRLLAQEKNWTLG